MKKKWLCRFLGFFDAGRTAACDFMYTVRTGSIGFGKTPEPDAENHFAGLLSCVACACTAVYGAVSV